jgi:hypothetical protein
MMEKRNNPTKEKVMSKVVDLIMITALAIVLGLDTACFGLFTDSAYSGDNGHPFRFLMDSDSGF